MSKTLTAAVALSLVASAALAADPLLITGAGATFPAPLYTKWFSEYNKLKPGVQINYQSIGSGGGIKQITEKTVSFGATDAPMNEEELAKAPGVLHLPTVLGAVVITYNEPSITSLKLSSDTLAGIFLGKISKWNDPAIAKDNPGVKLPDTNLTNVHRSDGSGTTGVFTDYLAKVSPEFKTTVGQGKAVKWPGGLGGKGNEGVTGLVKQTPGAIGYVELAYANQNKLPLVALKNADGNYVTPSTETTSAAAAKAELPPDYRISITNAPGKDAYPISAFTYLLVYSDQTDEAKGKELISFLHWAFHEGQAFAQPLDYAPLPAGVVARLDKTLATITVQGKKLAAGK